MAEYPDSNNTPVSNQKAVFIKSRNYRRRRDERRKQELPVSEDKRTEISRLMNVERRRIVMQPAGTIRIYSLKDEPIPYRHR